MASTAVIHPAVLAIGTAVNLDVSSPLTNRLLASLPRADAMRLDPQLKLISLKQGLVLHEPGEEIEYVHFPHTGMVSLFAVMNDGRAVETATIGFEGAVGAMAGLGLHVSLTRAVVLVPVVASQIAAVQLRRIVQGSVRLRDLIVHYNDILLGQVQITAACNALHPIQARMARCILHTKDRIVEEVVPLTHELLSEILGVRRSSIGEIAAKLQSIDLIRYRRGAIEIVNRKGLEGTACECYETIKRHTAQKLL